MDPNTLFYSLMPMCYLWVQPPHFLIANKYVAKTYYFVRPGCAGTTYTYIGAFAMHRIF